MRRTWVLAGVAVLIIAVAVGLVAVMSGGGHWPLGEHGPGPLIPKIAWKASGAVAWMKAVWAGGSACCPT